MVASWADAVSAARTAGREGGVGSDRDQVEVLFDATRLLCQAPQFVRGGSVPRAVEVD